MWVLRCQEPGTRVFCSADGEKGMEMRDVWVYVKKTLAEKKIAKNCRS